MELKGMKKIVLLGIILLIVAGAVVVALKGFKVSLILQKHESLKLIIGKEVMLDDMNKICEDVFGDKTFIIRRVDRFDDAINVRVESITNEEKEQLVTKINDKYDVEIDAANITVKANSNIRIRDIIRPYVKPVIISAVLIVAFLIVRFRKMNPIKILGNAALLIVVTEAVIASVLSIARIPLTATILNVMAVVAVIELIIFVEKLGKKYSEVK